MSTRTEPKTLTEALLRAGREVPDRGLTLFDARGRSTERRTWPEVVALARRGASRWAALGVRPGDRVVVCLPSGWPWMETWLGALLLGARPVAMAPAGALGSSEAHVRRVAEVVERLDAVRWVASAGVIEEAHRLGHAAVAERGVSPESFAATTLAGFTPARPDPEEIAFLQLTSGSTGVPRAVEIPHRAAVHNNRASARAIGAPFGEGAGAWAEVMVSWLPLNHDMGLVGCLFMALTLGLDLSLMNPTTFLARPRLWLDELSRVGPSFAPAPNFGYQLLAERLAGEDLGGLDLSSFRAALVGAEMVRPETMEAFAALTAPAGFDPRSLRPCYGLAEGTLAVTFDLRGEGVRTRPRPAGNGNGDGQREVVCVGAPVADTELEIRAPDGTVLAAGEVGQVWVEGPGVFAGYHGDPEATAETLVDGWLATGDLGFLHDGELYLTGRLKDLLILRGHNLMPHELEWLAEGVTGGGGVERAGAFSIDGGAAGEQPVLVVETTERDPRALGDLARRIRLEVGHALSLTLADLAFVRRGRIPKTTSGKVQRRQLRRSYLETTLERLPVEAAEP